MRVLRKLMVGLLGFFVVGSALAATPVIEGNVVDGTTAATTSWSFDVSGAGTIQDGELLVICINIVYSGGDAVPTISGWTSFFSYVRVNNRSECFWKTASSEGSSYSVLESTAARSMAGYFARISGAEDPTTTAPQIPASPAEGNSGTWSIPTSATAGSSDDYLYLSIIMSAGQGTVTDNGDSDFLSAQATYDGGAPGIHKTHYSSTSTTSYSASAFSNSNTKNYIGQSIQIYPAAGGGGGTTQVFDLQRMSRATGPQRSQQLGGLLQ